MVYVYIYIRYIYANIYPPIKVAKLGKIVLHKFQHVAPLLSNLATFEGGYIYIFIYMYAYIYIDIILFKSDQIGYKMSDVLKLMKNNFLIFISREIVDFVCTQKVLEN